MVRREAEASRVAIEAVDVTNDPKRGMVAQVRTRGAAPPLRAALGRYAFAADVTEA